MDKDSKSNITLMGLLIKYAKSRERARYVLEQASLSLGLAETNAESVLIAIALCKLGAPPEQISRFLTWQEFERFCADIISSYGYNVTKNLILRKPRMQIDIVAESDILVIAADCKHWKANYTDALMKAFALKQLVRCEALRERSLYPVGKPIVPVIITLGECGNEFVDGVPIVPLFTLRNFMLSVETILDKIHTV